MLGRVGSTTVARTRYSAPACPVLAPDGYADRIDFILGGEYGEANLVQQYLTAASAHGAYRASGDILAFILARLRTIR